MELARTINNDLLPQCILPYIFTAQTVCQTSPYYASYPHLELHGAIMARRALFAWASIVLDYLEPKAFAHAATMPHDTRKSAIAVYISEVLLESGLYIRAFSNHPSNAAITAVEMCELGLKHCLTCLQRWAPHKLDQTLRLCIRTLPKTLRNSTCLENHANEFAGLMRVCADYVFLPIEVNLDRPEVMHARRGAIRTLPHSIRSLDLNWWKVHTHEVLGDILGATYCENLTRLYLNDGHGLSWCMFALPPSLTDITFDRFSFANYATRPMPCPPQLRRLALLDCTKYTSTTLNDVPATLHTLILKTQDGLRKSVAVSDPLAYLNVLFTTVTELEWHAVYDARIVANLPASLRTLKWIAHEFTDAPAAVTTAATNLRTCISNVPIALTVFPTCLTTLYLTFLDPVNAIDLEHMIAHQLPATLNILQLTIAQHLVFCGRYFARAQHDYRNLHTLTTSFYTIADANDALHLPTSLTSLKICKVLCPLSHSNGRASKVCARWIANLPAALTHLSLNLAQVIVHQSTFALLPRGLTHLHLCARFNWYTPSVFEYLPCTLRSMWLYVESMWTATKTLHVQATCLPSTLECLRLENAVNCVKLVAPIGFFDRVILRWY